MPFSEEKIQSIWDKGVVVDGYDATKYRKDLAGAWMQRDRYGACTSLGWEIDHVYPQKKGGQDDPINLRPMQWENNKSKNAEYPSYTTAITSDGDKNISKTQTFTVNENLQADLEETIQHPITII